MKFTKEDLDNVLTLLNDYQSAKPLIKKGVEVIEELCKEFEDPINKLSDFFVYRRIRSVKLYAKAGFSKKDAILMTLDDMNGLKKLTESVNKKITKKK